jgi:hypothetical protein
LAKEATIFLTISLPFPFPSTLLTDDLNAEKKFLRATTVR